MTKNLKHMRNQKVALVTGANRGIGFETAKQLGEQKITVILGCRKKSNADEAVRQLRLLNVDAFALELDVDDAAQRKAAAAYIESEFGKLDILVNNAGVVPRAFLNVETSPEDFEYVFKTNFFSIVHLTKELLPLLKKSTAGRIVNLTTNVASLSLQSMEDSPVAPFRSLAYNASKASLNMFTILLSEELKNTNIKVNSAHPGWVKTDMGTQQAPMEIKDGARTSVELALLGESGPSGKFIHLGEEIPW